MMQLYQQALQKRRKLACLCLLTGGKLFFHDIYKIVKMHLTKSPKYPVFTVKVDRLIQD